MPPRDDDDVVGLAIRGEDARRHSGPRASRRARRGRPHCASDRSCGRSTGSAVRRAGTAGTGALCPPVFTAVTATGASPLADTRKIGPGTFEATRIAPVRVWPWPRSALRCDTSRRSAAAHPGYPRFCRPGLPMPGEEHVAAVGASTPPARRRLRCPGAGGLRRCRANEASSVRGRSRLWRGTPSSGRWGRRPSPRRRRTSVGRFQAPRTARPVRSLPWERHGAHRTIAVAAREDHERGHCRPEPGRAPRGRAAAAGAAVTDDSPDGGSSSSAITSPMCRRRFCGSFSRQRFSSRRAWPGPWSGRARRAGRSP